MSCFTLKYWYDSGGLAYVRKHANFERFINKSRQGDEDLIFDCFHFRGNTIGTCAFAIINSFNCVAHLFQCSKRYNKSF